MHRSPLSVFGLLSIAGALLLLAGTLSPIRNATPPPLRLNLVPSDTCECREDDDRRGNVSDCCCTFGDLERLQMQEVHPLLQRITTTPFFAHFKVDLCSDCTLWSDTDSLCMLEDCSVGECESPPEWAAKPTEIAADASNCGSKVDDQINIGGVEGGIRRGWSEVPGWAPPAFATPSATVDYTRPEGEAVVVDLRNNPEQYTGYAGTSAARVWAEIHGDRCSFHQSSGMCGLPAEQRVYNRLLSGLHASISLHIAKSYCLEESAWSCVRWGANAELAHERVLRHPDRLENVYFAFALLMRAVVKAGNAVGSAVPANDPLFVGNFKEWRDELLPGLNSLSESCPLTFDETAFYKGSDAPELKALLRERLAQLHKAMGCVGCERCRLWGTLQALGIDVAARLLWPPPGEEAAAAAQRLTRQEAVALVNTLERFSSSLAYAQEFQRAALV